MKQIKFGYISPINYLHLIPEHQTFHLVLSYYLRDPTYLAFYKKKQERGDIIICDNMAFELKKSIPAEELIGIVEDSGLSPTYLVAPDAPFQRWEVTLESTLDFIERVRDTEYKVMAVPQSVKGDWKGWLQCYSNMAENDDIAVIGMSILGIPNAFCSLTGTSDIAYNRIFATSFLIENGLAIPEKWHHYLGLGGGPREILIQRQLGLMDSNDSSSPFWHGYLGIEFDDSLWGLKDGKSRIEVDFKAPYSRDAEATIKKNIAYMEDLILKEDEHL